MTSMRVVDTGGLSPISGLKKTMSDEMKVLWPHISALAPDRRGLLWKVGAITAPGTTGKLRGGLRADHMTDFLARDALMRKLIPRDNNVNKRHALLVKQVRDANDNIVFNRPCLQIATSVDGFIGQGKGSMEAHPSTDEDMIFAGGFAAGFDILIIPNGQVVKVTYSDDSTAQWTVNNPLANWPIFGSKALRNTTGNAFSIYIDTNGNLIIRTRGGTSLWDGSTEATNYKPNTPQRFVRAISYDPVAAEMKLYDWTGSESLLATKTSIPNDIDETQPGAKKGRLYTIGTEGNGSSYTANGCFVSLNFFLPDKTLMTSSIKRAALKAYIDAVNA